MYSLYLYFAPMLSTQNIADTLNTFIQEPEVKRVVSKLIGTGVPASDAVLHHPTILVEVDEAQGLQASLSFMGLLNGVLRVMSQPILVAHIDNDTQELLRFSTRDKVHPGPSSPEN